MPALVLLREQLRKAMRLAGQRSYSRRAPKSSALPHLALVRRSLLQYLATQQDEPEALRLLSLTEECLLHYDAAIAALERALEVSGQRNKADLKRLAALKGARGAWAALRLTPDELSRLGQYLEKRLQSEQPGRDLEWTRQWLVQERATDEPEPILESLRARGGYSDVQVLYNVVRG